MDKPLCQCTSLFKESWQATESQTQTKMGRRRQEKVIYSILLLWGRNQSNYTIPDLQQPRIFPKPSNEGISAAFSSNSLQSSTLLSIFHNALFESPFLEAGRTKSLPTSPVSTAEKVGTDIYEIHRKNSSPTASNLLCIACYTTHKNTSVGT